jgi:hypothetical protein
MEILTALCTEFILISSILILSYFTPFIFGIILGYCLPYLLPVIIVFAYLYLLIFETNVYNIPNVLQENLYESVYLSFLFILYIVYISTCQILVY